MSLSVPPPSEDVLATAIPTPDTAAAVAARVPAVDRTFPHTFLWGAATSSHQIEGAAAVDGRGPSIWDTFAARPGAVAGGDTAAVAVDHYHRWPVDLDLLAWLGVDAYRFSISWSRILPDASGRVNRAGIDFYRRLVAGLEERGIRPWATLYHWDLPQWLEDRGGWTSRDTVGAFVDYAATMAEALPTVAAWATHNEPWCAAFLGHRFGIHAPGRRDDDAAVAACHHLLLSHGRAVPVLQDLAAREHDDDPMVGIVLNLAPVRTPGTSAADREAVRVVDGGRNRAWLDPLFHGRYPEDVLADWEPVADLSVIHAGDLAEIAAPIDFLGINYYRPVDVVAGDDASPEPGADGVADAVTEAPTTAMGWPIDSTGLADVLRRVRDEHGPVPLYVTENGAAFPDEVMLVDDDGRPVGPGIVDDADRLRYLADHLRTAHDLVAEGVDLRGWFVWSLLDNFEWAEGYRCRFGIVHVDLDTLVRTPKASAHWYRSLVAASRPTARAEDGASGRQQGLGGAPARDERALQ